MTLEHLITATIEDAARAYIARQNRSQHPDGSFDGGGRWYPSSEERRECCGLVRSPSRAYPYSHMIHCRSVQHVALLYGFDVKELRQAIRAAKGPTKRPGGTYYKAVAVVPIVHIEETPTGDIQPWTWTAILRGVRYVSIFDGVTEYVLGKTLVQRVRKNHGGGYYVYETVEQAQNAKVPDSSALIEHPRVILHVEAGGQYTTYDKGNGTTKYAFSRITPIAVVETAIPQEVSA